MHFELNLKIEIEMTILGFKGNIIYKLKSFPLNNALIYYLRN